MNSQGDRKQVEVYWLIDSNLIAFHYKKSGLTIRQPVFLCVEEFIHPVPARGLGISCVGHYSQVLSYLFDM